MTKRKFFFTHIFYCASLMLVCCSSGGDDEPTPAEKADVIFGADLSYVNQILDHNGVFKVDNVEKSPYQIFADAGTDLVRLRLWHNPTWTKEVYENGTQLYNDLDDVEQSMTAAKAAGMKVLLDFHYSDTWADPAKQYIPEAWKNIKTIDALEDSVYNYTFKTLSYLKSKNLLPEYVQLGNETNCGMLFSEAPDGFPACNVCNGAWQNIGKVLNAGIQAVKDVSATSTIKTKIILHIADPKNVEWWFDNVKSQANVTDFDIVGFSFYPLWHTTVSVNQISDKVATFKSRYGKDVMILETAYPWTTLADDSYNNSFGDTSPITGYPFTAQGQYDLMKKLTTEVIQGGGIGVIYWEPAWITSDLKDLWGTGSSWENCAFFDFTGNANKGIEYMKFEYTK